MPGLKIFKFELESELFNEIIPFSYKCHVSNSLTINFYDNFIKFLFLSMLTSKRHTTRKNEYFFVVVFYVENGNFLPFFIFVFG